MHELLLVLANTGLDEYADRTQLLDVFQRMQAYQIACAADPNRGRLPAPGPIARRRNEPFRKAAARRAARTT